jgi:hypothetical protein
MLEGAPGVQRNGSHRRQLVDWQIGDFAICITPGSKLENRLVRVISRPLVDPSKADVVYRVHPGIPNENNWGWGAEKRHLRPLPDGIDPNEWEAGPFIPGELVH